MGAPCMEPELSSTSTHKALGSGLSANSLPSKIPLITHLPDTGRRAPWVYA